MTKILTTIILTETGVRRAVEEALAAANAKQAVTNGNPPRCSKLDVYQAMTDLLINNHRKWNGSIGLCLLQLELKKTLDRIW